MAMPAQYVMTTTIVESPQKPRFYNIHWHAPTGSLTIPDPQQYAADFADQAATQLLAAMAAVMTDSTNLVAVHCLLHTGGQSYVGIGTSGAVTGAVTGDEAADWVAAVIQKRTNQPGKSGRGRWYVGPVPESFTNENRLTDAARVAYETLGDSWVSVMDVMGDEWTPQLHSEKNQTLHPLNGRLVLVQLGSQRGRKSTSLV